MNNQYITMDEIKKESKRAQRREEFNRKLNNVKWWCEQNKELLIVFGPIVCSATVAVFKATIKHIKLHKEKDLKELYCYDRSLGHYWRLRRELSNSEWVKIDQRKQNGERLADILSEMKVLK